MSDENRKPRAHRKISRYYPENLEQNLRAQTRVKNVTLKLRSYKTKSSFIPSQHPHPVRLQSLTLCCQEEEKGLCLIVRLCLHRLLRLHRFSNWLMKLNPATQELLTSVVTMPAFKKAQRLDPTASGQGE